MCREIPQPNGTGTVQTVTLRLYRHGARTDAGVGEDRRATYFGTEFDHCTQSASVLRCRSAS